MSNILIQLSDLFNGLEWAILCIVILLLIDMFYLKIIQKIRNR